MTPDKNFRMDRLTKTYLALGKGSKDTKAHTKGMFIQAQLSEEAARRASLKSNDNSGENKGKTRGAVAPE
jgi:hypothetical protein